MKVQDFIWYIVLALVKLLSPSPINPVWSTSLLDTARRMEQRRLGTCAECSVNSMDGHKTVES
jgi:hypothetical protein